ncbi:MAG: helix-turn-helix domain-containing protein [Nocardioidaceae bacterium]
MTTATRASQVGPDKRWMTLQEAAVYIAASVKTVRRRIATGELPAYVCGNRGLRVLQSDLDNLMKPI